MKELRNDTVQINFICTLQMPTESSRSGQQSSMPKTDADWNDRSHETWNSSDPTPSSLSMLTKCFDKIFADLYLQVSDSLSE